MNLVEVAFTPRGDVIGTDNWYQQPRGGMRDALVHIVDGGLYPYHPDKGTPQPVTGAPLPAVSLYPAVAHSGLAYIQASALPGMQGNLASAQHNTRRVVRHELVNRGSTFETRDHDLVTTEDPDFHPSDVVEDADGTLLVIDTGSWYIHHCPTGQIRKAAAKGGIYRVQPQGWKSPRDPWGSKIGWRGASDARLIELLADERWAVSERASRLLVGRTSSSSAVLAEALRGEKRPEVSQRLIWVLSQIGDGESARALRAALDDSPVDVVTTAARGLALCRGKTASAKLSDLLAHKEPVVQLAAAEALGRCGSKEELPAVWDALRRKPDRFVDHALTLAAFRLADEPSLLQAITDTHPGVQRAAILISEQRYREREILKPATVFASLRAADRELSAAARWVLLRHVEWGSEALAAARALFEKNDLDAEERRQTQELIHAFAHDEAMIAWVSESITNAKVPPQKRVELLGVVTESPRASLPKSWTGAVGRALGDESTDVRMAAVRAAAVRQIADLDSALLSIADDDGAKQDLRFEALRAVVLRHPGVSSKSFELLIERLEADRAPEKRLAAAEVVGRCRLSGEQLEQLIERVNGDALISPSVLSAILQATPGDQQDLVADYLLGATVHGWQPGKAEAEKLLAALPSAEASKRERLRGVIDMQREAIREQLRGLRTY